MTWLRFHISETEWILDRLLHRTEMSPRFCKSRLWLPLILDVRSGQVSRHLLVICCGNKFQDTLTDRSFSLYSYPLWNWTCTSSYLFSPAMARVNLMKNIVTSRRQPHTPLDNVNTPYNPIRWTVTRIISSFCMVMLYRIDHSVFKSLIFCVSDCWRGRLPARRRSTTTSASSPSWRPATTSSTPSIASTLPWSRWASSLLIIILQSTLLYLKYWKHLLSCKFPFFITGLWGWVRLSPQAFWARCRGQVLSIFVNSYFCGQLACSWLLLHLIIFQRLPVPQPAASEGLRQPDQTCLRMSSCQKINALAILLINLMRAAVRMTTLLICNLAKFIQLKDDGHEDSADLLCDRLPIVLLARYRLHNQLCNFKHLCSASKLYKSYSIE